MVCYSPKKRKTLQPHFQAKSPVKLEALKKNDKEYTIDKNAQIVQYKEVHFEFNNSLDDHLLTIEQALGSNEYTKVDLKGKIMKKDETKQRIIKGNNETYKIGSILADQSDSIKLVLWENKIEEVVARKSYNFQNLTVRVYQDEKYVNTKPEHINQGNRRKYQRELGYTGNPK
ncbi:predicted protein [Nematostella vectensis]|uniref:Uncharacterized protein n=1 Tax=Nematostella vectensis TaxID=45351 RepID=A7RH81_NEMVE|nr:predicted protein [Nematostella vectensis]|eukprot:XP_001641370.1 predicted protein [Nematostella vectensis]